MAMASSMAPRAGAENDDPPLRGIEGESQDVRHGFRVTDLHTTAALLDALVPERRHPAVSVATDQLLESLFAKTGRADAPRDPCVHPKRRLEATFALDAIDCRDKSPGARAAAFVAEGEDRQEIGRRSKRIDVGVGERWRVTALEKFRRVDQRVRTNESARDGVTGLAQQQLLGSTARQPP